jgi:hypothetical protein
MKITEISKFNFCLNSAVKKSRVSDHQIGEKNLLSGPQKRTSNPALQSMKFLYFVLLLWVFFALLDPDPDPATQVNADPDPKL